MIAQVNVQDCGKERPILWWGSSNLNPPRAISIANDEMKADDFLRRASAGEGFVWRGDFQNAKNLLQAVSRRILKKATSKKSNKLTAAELFHRHRLQQVHRAQILSRLLVEIDEDLKINLPRAPDIVEAARSVMDWSQDAKNLHRQNFLVSLKDLLGFIGASEWRKKGVFIPALADRIHPFHSVYSPARGEYLDLIADCPLEMNLGRAFDIGTGTGVIAALLAKRGFERIVATDTSSVAIACAQENIERLGYKDRVEVVERSLFPDGVADLIVCNPPWIPAKPTSQIEYGIYDYESQMLRKFLAGARDHLNEKSEAWLILSNLAELLQLRRDNDLEDWIESAQLEIIEKRETRPHHPKSESSGDLLEKYRQQEVTRLYRLRVKRPR